MRRNADGLSPSCAPATSRSCMIHSLPGCPRHPAAGARVLWRCHVGSDTPNEWTRRAWDFLGPTSSRPESYIVSRPVFAPPWADARARACCAAVDRPLLRQERADVPPQRAAGARLHGAHRRGWCAAGRAVPAARRLAGPDQPARRRGPERAARPAGRADGHPGLALGSDERHGRCDGGFAEHVDPSLGAHLVLAGPAVTGVADDPEAASSTTTASSAGDAYRMRPADVYTWPACRWRTRMRRPPWSTPYSATQRWWSRRASPKASVSPSPRRCGSHGPSSAAPPAVSPTRSLHEHGLLVDDPADLAEFGAAVESLLRDPAEAERLGRNARERACAEYLGDRHLEQYGRLFAQVH